MREEDRARERLQQENLAREERMQQAFMAMLNAQSEREATRAHAEEEHKRQDEEQKQLEIKQRDAPKMVPMKEDADVEDFLGEFEIQMEDLRILVDRWMTYLRPLLTSNARDVIAILSREERRDYTKVKDAILEACGITQGRLGDRFWRATKPEGVSYVNIIPKWARLYARYVGETSSFEVRDAMLRDKLFQTLPPVAATCTCEGEKSDYCKASSNYG